MCDGCGAEIPPATPGGLCAVCLLNSGLETAGEHAPIDPADLATVLARPAPPLAVKFHSIGDYELLAEIARGGMGVLFRARQISLNRFVALKFIHPEKLNSAEVRRRFQIEAQAAASLNHPNIVTIHSVENSNSTVFLCMELVVGRSLNELIPESGFDLNQLLGIAIPLADALAAAHARGIGHRDLKPSNVMVNDQGRVKVIDFGLAKWLQPDSRGLASDALSLHPTEQGQILGTPAYMSPEQIAGRDVDHRTDLFSLGILLCEMATARRPFQGKTSMDLMASILRDAPLPLTELKPGLPEALHRIIGRCLEKNPDERYQSAVGVRDALKELGEQVRPELRRAFAMPRSSSYVAAPNNLPAQPTSFVGREQETAAVTRLLCGDSKSESSSIRLVTLTGPGGTGKTRLALQVAAGQLGRFPNGVWMVDLAGLSDPLLVPETVVTAMGLSNTAGLPPLQFLINALSPKQTLLLLDNCEHLLTACASLSEALLRACPQLHILATSREALRLASETVRPVPSLAVPDLTTGPTGHLDVDTLSEYESIRLFIERAQTAVSGFRLDPTNARHVAQLCHRLDGIPLAIELAAARLRLLSTEQLVDRVKDRFRLLTSSSRSALPRQQTLRALVDWSYDLLTDKEQLLFDRLSVFVGGWTLESAEAVCPNDPAAHGLNAEVLAPSLESEDVLDLLGHLLDKSMIVDDRFTPGEPRFRMLETLREYGQENLMEQGGTEVEALHLRHSRYFFSLGRDISEGMHHVDQAKWLERLEPDIDNLRATLERGKAKNASHEHVRLALRLARLLHVPWMRSGRGGEGRQHCKALLEHRVGRELVRERAQLSVIAGSMALWQDGDDTTAFTLLNEGLTQAGQLGDTRVVGEAHQHLGQLFYNRGDLAKARQEHEVALQLARANGHDLGIRISLENLADVTADEGDPSRAQELYEQALAQARQMGDLHGIASVLQSMGSLAGVTGDATRAKSLLVEALSIMAQIRCLHCSARYLVDLGLLVGCTGEPEKALHLLGAANSLRDRTGIAVSKTSAGKLDQTLAESRQRLGEAAYAAAWNAGRSMSLSQVTALATESIRPNLS